MSFWKTLEHDLVIVGKTALAIAPEAGAIVGMVNPAAGVLITGIAGKINAAIVAQEAAHPDPGQGAQKAANVVNDFQAALDIVQGFTGKTFAYDAAALQKVLDSQVAALNAMDAFKQTVKEK